ncbi:myo-inositol-1(or 4)-monophosphatase [Kwoniella heveanensis CBS 569]|uniref:Inositol-1-monophosphatase n=1 Tax=Kwoniella heveanensis BCC8398 TaxID=1296120 RepID=A0A1B9GTW2_9TREE|nr:myo-inositol-1(or 4)-monophosphatase [Kwoniella heveanensis BCC8398]OCF41244.1 myo-inositol-1(or 4)-monophosphatase [Kwoniella heveanensis CBS 569]
MSASPELDLDSILAFTIKLALDAGEMIRDGQQKRFASESASEDEKVNSVDLVTEVDKAVEEFITKKIKETYPDHQFIGEETFKGQKITDEPTWIGDPIDGTTNFIHGFPMVATSIGLAVKGVPVVGVVYNPFLDQLYSAAEGRGAYLNQKTKLPITGKAKPLASLGQALIAVEYGSSRSPPALPSKVKTFQTLAAHPDQGGKMVHSLRSVGSAAINIALVASGGLDMYWEVGCWAWDVCAGTCILREAGGVLFGPKGSSLSGEVDGDLLTGRKYLSVRGIASTADETTLQVQQRFAREFYDTTDEIEP